MSTLLENQAPDLTLIFGEKGREFLSKCVETLTHALPVEEVWLFGSCTEGKPTTDSDVDLFVVLADDHRLLRPNLAAFQVVAGFPNRPPVDVVSTTKSQWEYEQSHPFGVFGEIAAKGIKIYDKRSA